MPETGILTQHINNADRIFADKIAEAMRLLPAEVRQAAWDRLMAPLSPTDSTR